MAKRKARELLHRNGNGTGPQDVTFSSGIQVKILPFPARLWEDINISAFERFPEPVPPKKTVTVLGGTEEVDDLENPEYKAGKARVEQERNELLVGAMIDVCIPLDLAPYEGVIRRLEKYGSAFPEDPEDRRVEFLIRYVLRTKNDYQLLSLTAIEQLLIDDPEVAERIRYFQSDLEGAAAPDNSSPGPDAGERVEV